MNDNDREVLSRLMDGEWQDLDPSRCVADVCASEQQQQVWARYHLARDAMRGEGVVVSGSIADRVSAALADEPSYSNVTSLPAAHNDIDAAATPNSSTTTANNAKRGVLGSRWGIGAAGFAIAASAAMATVVGIDYWRVGNVNNPANAVVAASPSIPRTANDARLEAQPAVVVGPGTTAPQVDLVSNRGSYWVTGENGQRSGTEKRLNQLLSDHIEHSPVGDWRGMMPYSRLVGYDTPAAAGQ